MKLQLKIILSFFLFIFLSFVASYITMYVIWQKNVEERNSLYRERISKSISETLAMYYNSRGSFDGGFENVLVNLMTNIGLDPQKDSVGIIDSNFEWIIASPEAIKQNKNLVKNKIDSNEYLVYPIMVDFEKIYQPDEKLIDPIKRRIREAYRLGFISSEQANLMISQIDENQSSILNVFNSPENLKLVGSLVFLNEELKLEHKYLKSLLISFLIINFISIVVAYFTSRQIASPINKLTNATHKISQGIFDPIEIKNSSNSEFSLLTKSFNSMTNRMQEIQIQRRQLFSDIAHELRNPLTVLRINIEGILDDKIKPSDEKFEQINDQIILLSNLVNDLSLIATSESGELKLNKETVDIKNEIKDSLDSFIESAKQNNIKLSNEATSNLILELDRSRTKQIFANIISNALKYINSGDEIIIRIEDIEESHIIKIIDNGPGIDESKLDRIFERFYKVDPSRNRSYYGSGLGLAITKQLVNAHGWDIKVKSIINIGTEFHIFIPKDITNKT
jgi:signal transduction histidine kinase